MQIHFKDFAFAPQSNGTALLMITIPKEQNHLYDEIQGLDGDKIKVAEIDYYKEKRSMTANSYLWALIEKIARKLGMSNGDCYCKMIRDYGVSIGGQFVVKEAYPTLDRLHSHQATKVPHNSTLCTITREFQKNDTEWVQYQAFYGSSGYDSKEFSHLLDGVVQEAKDLGIETLDDLKLKELIEHYVQ